MRYVGLMTEKGRQVVKLCEVPVATGAVIVTETARTKAKCPSLVLG